VLAAGGRRADAASGSGWRSGGSSTGAAAQSGAVRRSAVDVPPCVSRFAVGQKLTAAEEEDSDPRDHREDVLLRRVAERVGLAAQKPKRQQRPGGGVSTARVEPFEDGQPRAASENGRRT